MPSSTVLEKEKDYYCQVLGEAGSEVDHLAAWKMPIPKFSSDEPFCYPLLL